MRFGSVPLEEAEGALLAHTHRLPGGVLRKGALLGPQELGTLSAAGVCTVVVARLEEGDVGEDEAARELASALAGPHVRVGRASTGRCNLFARSAGLTVLEPGRVDALNGLHESLTLACLPPHRRVAAGELVATVKVIPFAAPREALEACRRLAGEGVVGVAPFRPLRAALIMTRLADTRDHALDRAERVLRERIASLSGGLAASRRVPHEERAVAEALDVLLAEGFSPVLVLGASATVDRADVIPRAVELAGGTVERFGIPVDPGNLLLLAHGGGTPVVGMPGCARSPRPSGFDRVLERLAAGVPVDAGTLSGLGVGGLLKEILSRPQPREGVEGGEVAQPAGFPGPAGPRPAAPAEAGAEGATGGPGVPRVGAVVLAAGRSSRMGGANKLVQPLEGVALLARVVDAALAGGAEPVVVVTGHDAAAVEEALGDRPVRRVHNRRWAEGMSTSLAAGLSAVEGEVDGALVCLGDMPRVTPSDIRALVDAFDPGAGREVCVPVFGGKRGNPVLWSARYFALIRRLRGDGGARALLADLGEDVVEVEVSGAGVLVDVDTREALDDLERDLSS